MASSSRMSKPTVMVNGGTESLGIRGNPDMTRTDP
jgi:hypothetical protein